jgi:hypothetical protein
MEFILSIILGFIFCLPMLWVAKLKTDINILNNKIDFYRDEAITRNRIFRDNNMAICKRSIKTTLTSWR